MEPPHEQHQLCQAAIIDVIDEWERTGFESLEYINDGRCGDFFRAVAKRLGHPDWLVERQIQDFLRKTPPDKPGKPFSRKVLRKWPAVTPPDGMSWADMDKVSQAAGYGEDTHVWMTVGHRHYDAQMPEGTDNFLELPLFKKSLAKHRRK